MNDFISCSFCTEKIDKNAKKCKHCLEFTNSSDKPTTLYQIEKFKIKMEFITKIIFLMVLIFIFYSLKPTIVSLFDNTKAAEFMGVKIAFKKSSGFNGELTASALYYLIGSRNNTTTRYEEKKVIQAIDELIEKKLVKITKQTNIIGDRQTIGVWAILNPTEKGINFLNKLGFLVK
ncbi:MAG: hypothetical protein MJK08_04055 [Campylobacterales bacterium]|nr:hypothetical protein [Campylobacterales bacterium]